ncbi:MAG: manganese catalase family protein [Bacilli bacterium]|nr:manganese catalase family protein [Bacilli bacterium]
MKNDLSVYHSDMPYPEIKVSRPNLDYANLLMADYAGFISELSAINQYYYHYIVLNDVDAEIANMLKNISYVEIRHFDTLAKVILLLGGDPILFADANYWNGDYIYYGDNILSRLEVDLQVELDAIENYQKKIELIDDPYVKNILRRIILDEEVHVRLFKKAIEKVNLMQNPPITLTDIIKGTFP